MTRDSKTTGELPVTGLEANDCSYFNAILYLSTMFLGNDSDGNGEKSGFWQFSLTNEQPPKEKGWKSQVLTRERLEKSGFYDY